MFKIMIVEDDIKIRNIILENLKKWKFEGICVLEFDNTFNEFIKHEPQLVLMDINLPSFDGFYWCSKIREISKVPIIFISSRDSNMDVIMAINTGGDDFVQKPFSLDVLMAKINALLRRTYAYSNACSEIIESKGAILNLGDSSIVFDGNKIELTKNELKIIHTLMKENGRVVSREKIMRLLWQDESFVDDNTLTVNINRLRKKLAEAGLDDFIQTKKGQGYIVL